MVINRTIFFLISGVMNILLSCSQEFTETKEFKILESEIINWDENKNTFKIYLVNTNDTTTIIQPFEIPQGEPYESSQVSVLKRSNLKNIDKVVKVEIEYLACCVRMEDYYFLIDKKGDWIELPMISYVYCDFPQPFIEYRFPSQTFGQSNKISLMKLFPKKGFYINKDYENEIDSIKTDKVYHWDGEKIIE